MARLTRVVSVGNTYSDLSLSGLSPFSLHLQLKSALCVSLLRRTGLNKRKKRGVAQPMLLTDAPRS